MANIATDQDFALMQQMAGMQGATPTKLVAVFSMEPVELPNSDPRVIEAGRPLYEDQEFVTIYIPGDKDNVVFRPVRNIDKVQFQQQYQAFKAKQEQPVTGTPLAELSFLSKSQRAEFEAVGIRTAEHLRDMPDTLAQKFIGYHQVRQRVATYLEQAAGAAPALKLQAELDKRDQLMKQMEERIQAQEKVIRNLQKQGNNEAK